MSVCVCVCVCVQQHIISQVGVRRSYRYRACRLSGPGMDLVTLVVSCGSEGLESGDVMKEPKAVSGPEHQIWTRTNLSMKPCCLEGDNVNPEPSIITYYR
ncbi:hypothetical protein ATANTOWER_013531 [Ataeniobius toweri]|uniref:Uncharacterized protein n=1 Tax=Ataeniobius toweri TaxID=208326 RepID=A0ABU7A6R3_9TELE|nr:hypothetical protein [Ataeniobius toweri]